MRAAELVAQVPVGTDATPYGVLLAALALVGTVVGVAMKLTSGSQTRGDNAFAAHLQTLINDRDRALETSRRAETRANAAEQEASECRQAQKLQDQAMYDLKLRVQVLETSMRAAGLSPP